MPRETSTSTTSRLDQWSASNHLVEPGHLVSVKRCVQSCTVCAVFGVDYCTVHVVVHVHMNTCKHTHSHLTRTHMHT